MSHDCRSTFCLLEAVWGHIQPGVGGRGAGDLQPCPGFPSASRGCALLPLGHTAICSDKSRGAGVYSYLGVSRCIAQQQTVEARLLLRPKPVQLVFSAETEPLFSLNRMLGIHSACRCISWMLVREDVFPLCLPVVMLACSFYSFEVIFLKY